MFTTPAGQTYTLFTEALKASHLLIAGATGSGKSVLENGLISTLLYREPFDQAGGAELILLDPTRVELVRYKDIPHVLRYASEPDEMLEALEKAVTRMNVRYKGMQYSGELEYSGGDLYVIIDEFADRKVAQDKNIKSLVQRIAQLGRPAKVHIILCTQCPLAEVIPTKIKVNFDTRFCLRTATRAQSQYIMNAPGCELLPNPLTEGRAEGFFCNGSERTLYNIPYVREEEIQRLISHWTTQFPNLNRSHQNIKPLRISAPSIPRSISTSASRRSTASRTSFGRFLAFLIKAACAIIVFLAIIVYCSEHFQ